VVAVAVVEQVAPAVGRPHGGGRAVARSQDFPF
jgi:hypothetical protein